MRFLNTTSLFIVCANLFLACNETGNKNAGDNKGNGNGYLNISLKAIKHIGSVDERYQSYNIEMAEVIGGNFWKPYDKKDSGGKTSVPDTTKFKIGSTNNPMFQAIPPIDLYNARLRKLAAALGPAYMRVSGTWANSVYFQDNDAAPGKAPKGFNGVLTRSEWKGVIDFSKAVDAKILTSFAISAGVRNAQGIWTPVEAKKIVAYTKSIGGEIAAAELFNEPNIPSAGGAPAGYNAETFAKDEAAFRQFVNADIPGMPIVGPGSVAEGTSIVPKKMSMLTSKDLLSADPKPVFDIFSYHFYSGVSQRCGSFGKDFVNTIDEALSEKWLSATDTTLNFYKKLRDEYEPGKPIWLTETADAACGGNPWAVTFLDCFRYLYQMGTLAKGGVSVIYHNTLTASEYGLLDQKTHLPRPHYWSALLWHLLMGKEVYDAGKGEQGVYLFAHNMKNHQGGITLLIINTNNANTRVMIPADAQQYTLTSNKLQGDTVQLNGEDLQLTAKDELPQITGLPVKAGQITLPPLSISFITIADAGIEPQ